MKGLTSRRGRKQESRGQPLSPARSSTREEAEQRGGEKRDSNGGENRVPRGEKRDAHRTKRQGDRDLDQEDGEGMSFFPFDGTTTNCRVEDMNICSIGTIPYSAQGRQQSDKSESLP